MSSLGIRICSKILPLNINIISNVQNKFISQTPKFKVNNNRTNITVAVKNWQSQPVKMSNKTKIQMTTKRASVGSLVAGCCFSLCKKKKTEGDEDRESSQNMPTEHTKLLSSLSAKKSQDNLEIGVDDLSKSLDESGAFPSLSGSVRISVSDKKSQKRSSIVSVKVDITPDSKEKKNVSPQTSMESIKEQNEEVSGVKKKKKPPNFFIALQINQPEIIEGLKKVQDHVVKNAPQLKPALVSLKKLHITLMVFHAEDNKELDKAQEAFQETLEQAKSFINDSISLEISKVSTFKNQVVYADIKKDGEKEKLLNLAEVVISTFEKHGFNVREGRPFNPHLTLFKLSQAPKLAKKGIRKIEPHLYQDFVDTVFGVENVKTIQLLSMLNEKDEKGYYDSILELKFGVTSV